MRRMVVRTASGRVVTDVEVTEQQLAEGVARWIQVAPDCGVYVDGVLVSDEVRRAWQASTGATSPMPTPMPAPPVASAPAAPIEPEQLRSAAEAMQYAYTSVVKGWQDLLDYAQDFTKKSGEQILERERAIADEAARQRELTHKSMKDINLLERSVAATVFKDKLAAAGAHSAARVRQDDRMRFGDVVSGVLKTLLGYTR